MLPTDASRSPGDVDSAPVTPDVAARAEALVTQFPECFWFWRPDVRVRSVDDVRLVIRHLRAHGGHDAWLAAQDLHRCLSPHSKRTPRHGEWERDATFRKARVRGSGSGEVLESR